MYNVAVRAVTKGIYSHCELVFSDGISASASFIDHGVRFKKIEFDQDHWDFIDLPDELEEAARLWFEKYEGAGYDIFGNVRFVFWPVSEQKKRFFCSEAIAKSLGLIEAWRYDPNTLYSALKLIGELENEH